MLDHLVYASPDLPASVAELNDRLGVELSPGGAHVGLGTRNFLADLGDGRYLEVIGPDPDQPEPDRPRPFGIDSLAAPGLVAWLARVDGLAAAAARWRAAGRDVGPVVAMSRRRTDGVLLSWHVAFGGGADLGGLVPGVIDWGASPHPSTSAVQGLRLLTFTGFHPDPAEVTAWLDTLGLAGAMDVRYGPQPALRALLATPRGEVELGRSGAG